MTKLERQAAHRARVATKQARRKQEADQRGAEIAELFDDTVVEEPAELVSFYSSSISKSSLLSAAAKVAL